MKLLIIISILVMSFTVNAGALTALGTITLSGNGKGIIIAVIEGNKNTSCGDGLRYWFKPDTDYNRALLSILLSAQMSGKKVYLAGSGAGTTPCSTEYPYNGALLLSNITLQND
jgi:hypothetical protein